MKDWYYAKDGVPHGPFASSELKAQAAASRLGPNDLVFQDGMAEWVPARKVKGLFARVTIPPPLPDQPPAEVQPMICTSPMRRLHRHRYVRHWPWAIGTGVLLVVVAAATYYSHGLAPFLPADHYYKQIRVGMTVEEASPHIRSILKGWPDDGPTWQSEFLNYNNQRQVESVTLTFRNNTRSLTLDVTPQGKITRKQKDGW